MTDAVPDPGSLRGASGNGEGGLLSAALSQSAGVAPSGVPWLDGRRARARAWLEATGFPAPKEEAWRFTPIRHVTRVPYRRMPASGDEPPRHSLPLEAQVTFSNGAPAQVSSGTSGLRIQRFSELLSSDPARAESLPGPGPAYGDGFRALNDALLDDGVLVVARAGERSRLHVTYRCSPGGGPLLTTPRLWVAAEPGSHLTIVETRGATSGPSLECGVTSLTLAKDAEVEHVRFSDGAAEQASVWSVSVHQEQGSRYTSRVLTFGGALTRELLEVTLGGPGADCALDGLYTAAQGDLVDHHTRIVHARPGGTSRERYKGVIDRGGTAVFDGTIVVAKGALGTHAHQENRNLLVADDAVVHTKPHLEIDTDDVRCSHGATVGRLDPAQLFYLRSRGIDVSVARAALMYAFSLELFESVKDPDIGRFLRAALSARLPGGDAVQELS